MDAQDKRMDGYQDVIVKISNNLTELAEGQRMLNQSNKDLGGKVEGLSEEVKEVKTAQIVSEKRQTIHTGELFRDFILKVAIPVGVIGIAIAQIVKYLK